MKHIDLFSGIGGFSLAFDNIFYEQKNEHIFVEYDPFCQAVLKKHWPEAEIFGDIRAFTYTESVDDRGDTRKLPSTDEQQTKERQEKRDAKSGGSDCFLLTGGFPCQPFSQAGRRKGTEDDRYLWPEMFRVICEKKPTWVIAENVRGLVTWNDGMVLEQVCFDLEGQGYEVQPFIIPAVAVNAPHRRDRIWIVGNLADTRQQHGSKGRNEKVGADSSKRTSCVSDTERCNKNDSNPDSQRQSGNGKAGPQIKGQPRLSRGKGNNEGRDSWSRNWLEVATRLCRIYDGLPRRLDRNPRLKALGNAIVPQVAEEILKAIKESPRKDLLD
jgi:DNA (cytosine-5)-methyltransferase 1